MPFEKLIEFEYVHQIDKKKLATIILLVTLGFVVGVISCLIVFPSNHEPCPEKTFQIIPVLVNWFKAREICHLIKMKLISIEADEKQNQIMKEIKEAGLERLDFWTSGTRTNNNGTFFWMETGQNFTFTNWAEGEPNKQAFNNPEECLNLQSSKGMQWNDVPCHFDHHVICEK